MPSSAQRIAVWKGQRAKTSGGLTRSDLIKNKRGRIVSKAKSQGARDRNNLGKWLLAKGAKVSKSTMLHPKKSKPDAAKPKPAVKKAAVKKAQKAPARPAAKVKPVASKPKAKGPAGKKLPPGYNPITKQPYEDKTRRGYDAAKVNLDNITTMGKEERKRRGRRRKLTREEMLAAMKA